VAVRLVAATALSLVAVVGPPTSPPPKVAGVQAAPPPAWVEAAGRSVWAAYGSYCWKTACADMLPPALRPDLPRLTVARGGVVRLHLRFVPRSATVGLVGSKPTAIRVTGARVISWHARLGIVGVSVKGAGGSASYYVRLR
jgi:hypothetical protein